MSDTKVGVLIPETAQRDAIHIAVAPVVSAGNYRAGEHVGLLPDGQAGTRANKKIGIIDPFLKDGVRAGERCWLFLYPQTVTGMRHHWSHPSFGGTDNEKSKSENWLRTYAIRLNTYDEPEQAFQRLIEGLKSRDITAHGRSLCCAGDLDNSDELREHAERFLGIRINWGDYQFSCSC